MPQTIRVRILNRDFALRVQQEDEDLTLALARYVDDKVQDFLRAHPEQQEITACIMTAMAIAEELFTERERRRKLEARLDDELGDLARKLNEALAVNGNGG